MADKPVRRVIHRDEGEPFTAIGGQVRRLIHPTTVDDTALQISLCEQDPGEVVRAHRHDVEEAYYVTQGTGIMVLEGHPTIDLAPGVAVHIPSGAVHGQKNTGSEPLVIVCALAPPLQEPPELIDDPKFTEPLG